MTSALQKQMLKLLSYITIGLFLIAGTAHAQSFGSDLSSVRLIASPEVPGPNTPVRLEIQGVGTLIGDSTITWYRDGTAVSSGTGERSYSFTTGSLGEVTRIRVVVESPNFGTMTREISFAPAQVYLVWEAETSVPPFFRGKAQYSLGSNVTVTAFPQVIVNGSTLSPNNLSFQWERNGSAITGQSGKGRNVLAFAGDQLKTGERISVDVKFGEVLVARNSVFIPATDPAIVFYPRDPLRGVLFDQALPSAISLESKEIAVQAVPYFFASESLTDGSLTYQWTLNNIPATGPDAGRGILTLRQSGEGGGEARLEASLQNLSSTKLLQAATAIVRIIFGNEEDAQSAF